MKKQNKKTKILVWADSPAVATGFATVARGIFNYLASTGKYDIEIVGINDGGGWKDPVKYPYKIYPARSAIEDGGDYYGRPRVIAGVLGKDRELVPPWDIIFTLNDPFIMEQPLPVFNTGMSSVMAAARKAAYEKLPPEWFFKIVSYLPVDSPIKGNWVQTMAISDYVVAYTKYAQEELLKADAFLDQPTNIHQKTSVLYHGYNDKEFYPIDRNEKELVDFKKAFFKGIVTENTFVVTSIARNQPRKDIPRTMRIFKEFQKRRPDSFLYLHAQANDAGGSLLEYARQFDLRLGEDWACPQNFTANQGFSIDTINKIYNSSDVIISSTLGEGFGFYNMEGMATKKVVLAPNNTVHPELFNYDKDEDITDMSKIAGKIRGIPYLCGSTSSEWVTQGSDDYERLRPLGNVDDAVKKLLWIHDNPEKAELIADRGYKWVKDLTWNKVGAQWDVFFDGVMHKLEKERKKSSKSGRKTTVLDNNIDGEVE